MTDYLLIQKGSGKIHLSSPGSSTCNCRYWLQTQTSQFSISKAIPINKSQLCEKCFGPNPEWINELGYKFN